MKILQVTAVRSVAGESPSIQVDVEPIVIGLGDDGRIYRWEYTESKWHFMGNNISLDPYRQ